MMVDVGQIGLGGLVQEVDSLVLCCGIALSGTQLTSGLLSSLLADERYQISVSYEGKFVVKY